MWREFEIVVAESRAPDGESAPERWRSNRLLLAVGGVAIVAGGLVAALARPMGWDHGSWLAAFLVLVAGVSQVGIGAAQAHLGRTAVDVRFTAVECVLWNGGCLGVVTGSLLASPAAVAIFSAPLVAVLAMSSFAVRQADRKSGYVLLHRLLVGTLLVSIPIGIALAFVRG